MLITQRASGIIYKFVKTFHNGTYLLPANVCPIVPLTLHNAGVSFEFVDIDNLTLCIDEQKCLELFSLNPKKYQGIIFVRTYGYIYDTTDFFQKLRDVNEKFKIIDDRCLVIPDVDIKVENCDLILYSTGYAKPINVGFGGIGLLNENIIIDNYNESGPSDLDIEHFYKAALENNRILDSIPLGWLDTRFYKGNIHDYLETIEKEKNRAFKHKEILNNMYKDLLPKDILMFDEFQNWRFNILVDNKELLLEKIFENKLFASSHYKPTNVIFNNNRHLEAEKLYHKVINLFNDSYFTLEQAGAVCKIINRYLKSK
ncbi:MAG: hypothetical protein WCJ61_09530 [Paludibacter sp.]